MGTLPEADVATGRGETAEKACTPEGRKGSHGLGGEPWKKRQSVDFLKNKIGEFEAIV